MPPARTLAFALVLLLPSLVPAVDAAAVGTLGELDRERVGNAAVYLNGATYIFGGRLKDGTLSDDILKYDHATDTLTPVADLPLIVGATGPGRYAGAAVAVGNRILYFGGAAYFEIDISNPPDGQKERVPQSIDDIVEYNPATNTVRKLGAETDFTSEWGMSAVAFQDKVYLFGGFSFDLLATPPVLARHSWVLRYDLSRPEGTRMDELAGNFSYAFMNSAAAVIGTTAYVFGGLADHHAADNPCPTYTTIDEDGNEVERQPELCRTKNIVPFDLASESVRLDRKQELPYRADFVSAVVTRDAEGRATKAYIPGGQLADGTPGNAIVVFEPSAADGQPVKLLKPTLPEGFFGGGVSTDGTVITLFGGRNGRAESAMSDRIVTIDPRPSEPWGPTQLEATGITNGLRLTWQPPTYDGDSAVSSYRVYRSQLDTAEEMVKETSLLQWDDMSVQPGQNYTYRVTAVNAVGESSLNTARVTVTAGVTPPGEVASFDAFPLFEGALLQWSPPTSDGGSPLAGYRVYRDGAPLPGVSLSPDATEFRDSGLVNGQAYAYTVRAYNSRGDGASSPERVVVPADVPSAPSDLIAIDSEGMVTLQWSAPPEAWDLFIVYRNNDTGLGEVIAEDVRANTFQDTTAVLGETYHYQVRAAKGDLLGAPSSPAVISLVRAPGAPQNVRAVGIEGAVRVTWEPPADTGDADPASLRYLVKRGNAGGGLFTIANDVKTLVFTDTSAVPGLSYSYSVTTLNPKAGPESAAVTATAIAAVNKPPVAALSAFPAIGATSEPVTLDASQSTDPDGAVKSYLFDFGDGSEPIRSATPTLAHTYVTNGSYTASVVATDDKGEVSSVATTRLVIGELEGDTPSANPFEGIPGSSGTSGSGPQARPGSSTPALPGPGLVAVLAVVALAALVAARRRA